MSPLVKKAVTALAIKEGIERIAEARRPKKRKSVLVRIAKLAAVGGAVYGAFKAYKSGLLAPITDKISGGSSYEGYEGSVTVSRPAGSEQGGSSHQAEGSSNVDDTQPVGSPTA